MLDDVYTNLKKKEPKNVRVGDLRPVPVDSDYVLQPNGRTETSAVSEVGGGGRATCFLEKPENRSDGKTRPGITAAALGSRGGKTAPSSS